MPILDERTLMSDKQAITATAVSTNDIDLGADGDIGKGTPVPILVQVDADFDNLTSLQFDLETDTDPAFGTAVVIATSGAVPLASLVAGYKPPFRFLPQGVRRYLRMNYTVVGTAPTTGTVTAGLSMGQQEN